MARRARYRQTRADWWALAYCLAAVAVLFVAFGPFYDALHH